MVVILKIYFIHNMQYRAKCLTDTSLLSSKLHPLEADMSGRQEGLLPHVIVSFEYPSSITSQPEYARGFGGI